MTDVDEELERRLDAAYDEDGVDRSLIRASLAKTPTQRLADLESLVAFVRSARRVSQQDHGPLPPASPDPD